MLIPKKPKKSNKSLVKVKDNENGYSKNKIIKSCFCTKEDLEKNKERVKQKLDLINNEREFKKKNQKSF